MPNLLENLLNKTTFITREALALINDGLDANTKGSDGNSLLHRLVTYNKDGIHEHNLKAISTLVQTCQADINCKNNAGITPLQSLIDQNFWRTRDALFLINLGANPNTQDSQGQPLTHRLVTYHKDGIHEHNRKAISTLVKTYKVDINCKNYDGKTPLKCLMDKEDNFNVEDALFLVDLINYSAELEQFRTFCGLTLDYLSALISRDKPTFTFFVSTSENIRHKLHVKSVINTLNEVIFGRVNYTGTLDQASVASFFMQSSAQTPMPLRQFPSNPNTVDLALQRFEAERAVIEESSYTL